VSGGGLFYHISVIIEDIFNKNDFFFAAAAPVSLEGELRPVVQDGSPKGITPTT
jgi:hypothetical protein